MSLAVRIVSLYYVVFVWIMSLLKKRHWLMRGVVHPRRMRDLHLLFIRNASWR